MTVSCQRGAVMYCTNYNHEGKDEWGDDVANNDVGKLASKDRVKRKHSHKCYIYTHTKMWCHSVWEHTVLQFFTNRMQKIWVKSKTPTWEGQMKENDN